MLKNTGIPAIEDLAAVTPSDERFARGPVAIVECFEEIPCNPCVDACKRGAIMPLKDINDPPKVDFEKCNGCGLCIVQCPGLAIFVVDMTHSRTHAIVRMPYEFIPVPEQGQIVSGLDRAGKELGRFEVMRVVPGGQKNKTAVIWIAAPKEFAMDVRHIRAGGLESNG